LPVAPDPVVGSRPIPASAVPLYLPAVSSEDGPSIFLSTAWQHVHSLDEHSKTLNETSLPGADRVVGQR
jgi:hypothetical protein